MGEIRVNEDFLSPSLFLIIYYYNMPFQSSFPLLPSLPPSLPPYLLLPQFVHRGRQGKSRVILVGSGRGGSPTGLKLKGEGGRKGGRGKKRRGEHASEVGGGGIPRVWS
jgi:hypothetical protein